MFLCGHPPPHLTHLRMQVRWVWGDTTCPRSPRQNNCNAYGMFSVGATSCIPSAAGRLLSSGAAGYNGAASFAACEAAGLPPNLTYFTSTDGGFSHVAPLAAFPPFDQNTWLAALLVVGAGTPSEALFANFMKNPGDAALNRRRLQLHNAESGVVPITGMAVWSDDARSFRVLSTWPAGTANFLNGAHTVQRLSPADSDGGWVYFANPLVSARVPATAAAIANFSSFEQLTPSGWVPASRAHAVPLHEARALHSRVGAMSFGSGSVNWNAWAGQYLFSGDGSDATSGSAGNYVALAGSLYGPWDGPNASWVGNHSKSGSSCYNSVHLPHMDAEGGAVVHFACTYTAMWSETLHTRPSSWTTW